MANKCPKCGNFHVRIEAMVLVDVFPAGTDRDESDAEWEDDSYAECGSGSCDWTGTAKETETDDEPDEQEDDDGEEDKEE